MKEEKYFNSISSEFDFNETSPSEKSLDEDFSIELINGNLNGDNTNEYLASQFALNINDLDESKKKSSMPHSKLSNWYNQRSLKSNMNFFHDANNRYNSTPIHFHFKSKPPVKSIVDEKRYDLNMHIMAQKYQIKQPLRNKFHNQLTNDELRTVYSREKSVPNLRKNPSNFQKIQNNYLKDYARARSAPNLLSSNFNSPIANRNNYHQPNYFYGLKMPQSNYYSTGTLFKNPHQDPNAFHHSQGKSLYAKSKLDLNTKHQNPYNYNSVFQALLSQPNVKNIPTIKRNYNFIGVVETDPNKYTAKYGQDLINNSKLPNLEITKWANKNNLLPYNHSLVTKKHKNNVSPLFKCRSLLPN
jgi:hypothetical protein